MNSVNARCRDLDLNDDDITNTECISPDVKETNPFSLTSIRLPAQIPKDKNLPIIRPVLEIPPQERVTFFNSPISKSSKRRMFTETSNDSTEFLRRSKEFHRS